MSLSKPPDEPIQLDALRTPLEIVNRMQWVLFYLQKATHVIKDLRSDHIDAKDAYSKAAKLHVVSLAGQGSAADRESAAQLANWELYDAMVVAEKALQYAKEKKDDLSTELSALQTESKLVLGEMQLSGKAYGA